MGRTITVWLLCVAGLVGCAGKGDIITLDIDSGPPANQPAGDKLPSLTAIILPFEDLRAEKGWVGTRTHFWGGETHFDVPGRKPGDMIAEQLAQYLRQHGWQVTVLTPRPGNAPRSPGNEKADVTFKGQVLDMEANAKSRFGSTRMTARVKLALQIRNAADGSVAQLTVSGARSDTEMVFEPEYLAHLFNAVVYDSFERLSGGTKVEGRTLQIR